MNTFQINLQSKPNIEELSRLFEAAFNDFTAEDNDRFVAGDNSQDTLAEWFDINSLPDYLKYGCLLEARDESGKLAGAIFAGRQNPLTWPDGRKAEIFILGVASEFRGQSLGSQLVTTVEAEIKKMGAQKIIVNTHQFMEADQHFYEKLGYQKIGTLSGYYANGDAVFYSKVL